MRCPQEISILKSISYDRNIVQFYGAVLSNNEPMLVLEYMEVCHHCTLCTKRQARVSVWVWLYISTCINV